MRLNAAIALLFLVFPRFAFAETEQLASDAAGFAQSLTPFLSRYCADCHGAEVQEGDVALLGRKFADFADGDVELWTKVGEQLAFNRMPPADAPQPSAAERARTADWLEAQLRIAGASPDWKHKLNFPDYGNLIAHHAIFDPTAQSAAFTPSRLWKKSPDIFDSLLRRGMGFEREGNRPFPSRLENVKQPFTMEDRAGVKDFAAIMLADSSTLDTMLRNAEVIVDQHLGEAFEELDRQNAKSAQNPQTPPPRSQFRPTAAEFRQIVLHRESPTDSEVDDAVRKFYDFVIEREPAPAVLEKYRRLFRGFEAAGGAAEALRTTLIAVAVSPPAVYRQEIGSGPRDEHGRQMLSPANLAFALAYALTDSKPDAALLAAAKEGRLTTKADVAREGARMWDDKALHKPRILRFFQEFFGYHRAPQVFKDDARFGGGYNGNSRVADWLVLDADTLVMHIVRKDRDVLAELLTTEKYFIAHNGDNRRAREIADAQAAVYEYLKDKDWQKWPYNLPDGHGGRLHKLDPMYSHVNGPMIHRDMTYLAECKKLGIQPMPSPQRREFIRAYNLDEKTFDYPVEQPFALAPGKRAGILMHPAWLIAHSLNLDNDPVRRGKWIRERLLADAVPEVPITVDATLPDEPDQTLRHRLRVTEASECWRCHVQMNPLGLPFEAFDDFGRYRQVERLQAKDKTAPVDCRGVLSGTGVEALDGPVDNPMQLVQRLARSERVRQSFVRHAFRYWMGRNEMLSDAPTLVAADRAYVESGGSFRALVLSLLTSDSFLYRKTVGAEHAERTP